MISLIIFAVLILFFLSNNFNSIYKKEEIFISNLITSLVLSISVTGIISIGLIFTELTKLPIIFISILTTIIYSTFYQINNKNIKNFFYSFNLLWKIFKTNFGSYKFFIIVLMLWLYFISFGPISHPDSITTYVGYPYQFFLQNKHFIDGGLHQGLLGISDFANLSFIQERNIWLIRSVQALPLVLIVSIFLLRKTNSFFIIAFLTCPVFIQWLTIGKYNFLPDISITITYLVWVKFKEKNSLLNLIIVIFLSLSFKISCLIISIPIALHILFEFFKNKQLFFYYSEGSLKRVFTLFFAILALFFILIYRQYITGNLFYPILNSYFVPDNQQMVDFENFLRSFMRDEGFPFNLVITNKIKYLGMILGPSTGLLLVSIPLLNIFFSRNKSISSIEFVAICQLILLLTISQGRADYFLSPVILMFMAKNEKINKLFFLMNPINSRNYLFKMLYKSSLILQIFIFTLLTLTSGYQTIYGLIDYEAYMKRYAYNYELTNILNNSSKEPIMNTENNRTALLFLNKKYIHEDKLKKCENYNGNKKNYSVLNCAELLNAKSVIAYGSSSKINEKLQCTSYYANHTSRNPFNLKKRLFHICNKPET